MTHREVPAPQATEPDTTLDGLIKEIQRHALALLQRHNGGLTEYSLMQQLAAMGIVPFCDTPRRDPLQLFQQHFMLFHALYTLRSTLAPQQHLHIHCLEIRLAVSRIHTDGVPAPHDALSTYYLDIQHLTDTDANALSQMLRRFWTRISPHQKINHAYHVLGLKSGCSPADITARYRKLAMQHHPDRGGNQARFMEISQAFKLLTAAREP